MSAKKYLVGVDEVGRGPLAGPVCVAAYALPLIHAKRLSSQKDSKQLTPSKREVLAKKLRANPLARFAVASVSPKEIDRIGLTKAIRRAADTAVNNLDIPSTQLDILLDGGLRVEEKFKQQTVIRGDATIPVIAFASIIAKVHRDRLMAQMAKKYPGYGFERNSGYGTKQHILAIKTLGTTPIHRKLFLRKIVD